MPDIEDLEARAQSYSFGADPGFEADLEESMKDYEETLRYAYVGDLHRASHEEVEVDWDNLPKPTIGDAH